MFSPLLALIVVSVVFTGGILAFVVYVAIDLSNVMEKERKEKGYKLSNYVILALARQKSHSYLKENFPKQIGYQISKKEADGSSFLKE